VMRTRDFTIAAMTVLAVAATAHAQTATPTPSEEARELNLRSYVELLRSDVRSETVAIMTGMMQFTDAEDAKFWPIYRQFEADLAKINDDRMALIKEYADQYETMTDPIADRLAQGALELEARRHALKVSYYARVKEALSPKTAARFLQVENQILLLLDLQIAAALPVVTR